MKSYQLRLDGPSEISAESSIARRRHVVMGLLGYFLPVAFLAIGITTLVESAGVDVSQPMRIGLIAVLLAVVLWRGGTVSAGIRADGVRVRNRWRQLVVPWDQITAAEVGSSIPYGLFDLVDDMANESMSGSSAEEDMQLSDILLIERRGRRRRLPVYATLGLARRPAELQAFVDALAARGIDVTHERRRPG